MKDWVMKKLDDVCELITCGVAARPEYIDNGIPFLSAKNVKDGKINWSNYNCISQKTHQELTKNNKPLIGDILYTRVGSYGEAAVIEDEIDFSVFVSLTLIKVDKKVLNNYFLKYYLNSDFVKKLAKRSISGSGVGNLNVGTVRDFPILLPSIEEQNNILSSLDKATQFIDSAKANAEKNLKNAKELFESYLIQLFEKKGKNWDERSIGEICTLMTGGTPSSSKPEYYEKGQINWLVSGDVNRIEINACDGKITELGLENSSTKFLPINSVIIALNGQGKTRGTVAMIRIKAVCNQSLVSIYPKDQNKILSEYIFYNLKVRYQEIRRITGDDGNDRRGLNMPLIRNIVIPFPKSIKEQEKMIIGFANILAKTQKLAIIYKQKITYLEELKKSILQKAFSGELTSKSKN